jgi:hypothetical protein
MGFTIEDKALLINQLISDFSRGRQPIKRLYDQAKKNVSIKQKIGLFSFWSLDTLPPDLCSCIATHFVDIWGDV